MLSTPDYQKLLWLAPSLAAVAVIARVLWLYRGSQTWPTADGAISRLDIERKNETSRLAGHYYCATFTYEFHDANGNRFSGTWSKNFSSEAEARDFAALELPASKPVIGRFNPRNPASNYLELDSWTYTNDRPTSLNI
ncbi:MAG TPA: DUF3592 domain-containing protein [Candidatus Angelobacter sp.]|nr:DUF3592 domain-containing protein [Candidatus Angelobacter sp.]